VHRRNAVAFTAPGRWLARVSLSLLAHYWAPLSRAFSRPRRSTAGVGAYHSSSVSSLDQWGSISAVGLMRLKLFWQHARTLANNRRSALHSPRMSDRCWQLSESWYPARSPSM